MVNGIKDFTLGVMSLPFDTLFLFIDGIGQLFGQDWGILDWFQGVKQSILDLNLGQWQLMPRKKQLQYGRKSLLIFKNIFKQSEIFSRDCGKVFRDFLHSYGQIFKMFGVPLVIGLTQI